MLSPDDKKVILGELLEYKERWRSPRTPGVAAASLRSRATSAPADGSCHACSLPVDTATGLCSNRHYTPQQDVLNTPTTPVVSSSPHKRIPVNAAANHHATSPVTYRDLGRTMQHKIRCYISSDHVLRLVRKSLRRNNATLTDAEDLNLKCTGAGEYFSRLENLGGLTNLKKLTALHHQFTRMEGLQPLVSLTHLNLSSNRLQRIENVSNLVHLQELVLDHNFIEHVPGENVLPKSITYLSVASNRLSSVDDLHNLRSLVNLQTLDLRDNTICSNAHYRSIAAYSALGLLVLDGVEVTNAERNAALYHWDRKGLKPLQSELVDVKKEVEALRRALEEERLQSAQTSGQLQAVSKMLEMAQGDTETAQREKNIVEEELRNNESRLSQTQTDLLKTKSDYEFLKLELETIYPDAAKDVIDRCRNTLGGDASSSATSETPVPAAQHPVAVTQQYRGASTERDLHERFAAMLDLQLRPPDVATPPSHAPTPSTPPQASPNQPSSRMVSHSVPPPPPPHAVAPPVAHPAPVSPRQKASAVSTPVSMPERLPSGQSWTTTPRSARLDGLQACSRGSKAHVSATSINSATSTPMSKARRSSSGGTVLKNSFRKALAKALHCEKCAYAYKTKWEASEGRCSGEYVMGELHDAIPNFPADLDQTEVLQLAKRQLEFHKEKADHYRKKQETCEVAMERYLSSAREILHELSRQEL